MKKINFEIEPKVELVNYGWILLGSFFLALGMIGFLAPNQIATGGTAGLAIVLNHVINLPIGILMLLVNIPLLLVSVKLLGRSFAFKSIFAIVSITVIIDLLGEVIHITALSNDSLLATLYGGIAVGLGLGLIFKGGGSAGGGTIIARIVTQKTDFKTGHVILVLDAIVVISAGVVFESVELALWSMISIFVASKLIDLILTGRPTEKIVHISSSKNLKLLSQEIISSLGVGGTLVSGQDLSVNEKKDVIFITIERNRLSALKELVYQFDNQARMVVMEAAELLGENKVL
ncbi:MAG: YitT family protein [Salibacteraceae bacterium]